MYKLILLSLVFLFIPSGIFAQQTVKESSTGKYFPSEIKIKNAEKEVTLQLTGLTVRKKIIFKVYGIAHYMQDPPTVKDEEAAFIAILQEGKAKQITMDFSRDVEAIKIKEAYLDGFNSHTSKEELQKLQPLINQFTGYFTKDVKENQQFILQWLPGGTILAVLNGETKQAITDPIFARVLWTIWFGEDSIVDRDDLVSRMIGK
ncbi:MAG: hypothetical protein C0417_00840 [Chlorobiaceae bacterium]|nr:hypothetical protein [Chlorobiaceae bacterium]